MVMSESNDDLFVSRYKLDEKNNKKIPIYENFCIKCKTSSDNVHAYKKGLLRCTLCSHIFTIEDVEKKISDYWKNI